MQISQPLSCWKVLTLTLFLAAISATCWAGSSQENQSPQSPLKQLSLEQLGNVEVTTASKEPEQVWKTPAAIFVITQDDIQRSGATSIPEALRLAPGVEVARIDSSKWSIGIRGFGSRLSRSVLVLIDGRTVYTTLFAGTYWEVQDTVMDDIERIEVIRGPGGTIWGPNAVDGVINIITKDSKQTQGLLASTGGGNEEQGFASVRYGGANTKGLSYRLYGKGFNRGPEYHSDGQNFDRWRAAQGGFRVDWTKSTRDSFTFQGDIYDEVAGESVQLVSYTPPFSQIVNGNADLSGGNIMGRWKRVLGEGNDLQIQAYYDRTNRHEPNFGDLRNTFDIDFLQRFNWRSRQKISWGLGLRISEGDELQLVSGLTFNPSEKTDQLYTAFLQDEISLVPDRLTLEVGTKLLHTDFTGAELEPSVRLLWNPTPTQTFWAAFTRAVRTPSDSERDFNLSGFGGTAPNGLPLFARFNANPNFQSEKLNGYELGYRRLVGKATYVDVTGFHNSYDDLFSEEITGPAFIENNPAPPHVLIPAQFRNGLFGSTSGVEIAPEWKPTSYWRLRGSYSFLQMDLKKKADSLDVGTPPIIEGSSPRHQLLVQSGFDLPKRVTLDLSFRYISALPGQMVPAYSTGDIHVGWRISQQIQLSIVGLDLMQPHHFEFGSDPGPLVGIKRSYYAKLTWNRNK